MPDETRAYVAKFANLLAIELPPRWTSNSSRGAILHAIGSKEDARSVAGAHAVDWCHDGNFSARCFTHGPMAYWRIRPSIGFGRIAMTNCVSSQADGVWAMPSARALLVALLLTEPPFVCLGPSGNDRYRKRSEAAWASRVGCRVAAAFSGTGGREITMDLEDEGSSNRASRYRCTGIRRPWPNPEPGATTWKVVATRESSDEILCWIGRRP